MPSLYTVVIIDKQLYDRERQRFLKCEMGWWLQQIQENNKALVNSLLQNQIAYLSLKSLKSLRATPTFCVLIFVNIW